MTQPLIFFPIVNHAEKSESKSGAVIIQFVYFAVGLMTSVEYVIFKCTVCNVIFSRITQGYWDGYYDKDDFWNKYFVSFEYGRLDKKGNYRNPLLSQCLPCKEKGLKEVDNR